MPIDAGTRDRGRLIAIFACRAMMSRMIRDPDTLAALRDGVARFVRDSLIPNEALVADTDAIPEAIVAEMKALGLFGLSIPEAYGGLGLTMEEEVAIAFETRPHSPAFRSLLGTNNGSDRRVSCSTARPSRRRATFPGSLRRADRLRSH
jgi:alkylation response protein AidB-like acyl-CoA dehydrogenase